MKILRRRQHHEAVSYGLFFERVAAPGSGFSFACDEHGNVDVAAMQPAARASDCGSDYNWAGQQLAPRSQWGEETGESLADILRIR